MTSAATATRYAERTRGVVSIGARGNRRWNHPGEAQLPAVRSSRALPTQITARCVKATASWCSAGHRAARRCPGRRPARRGGTGARRSTRRARFAGVYLEPRAFAQSQRPAARVSSWNSAMRCSRVSPMCRTADRILVVRVDLERHEAERLEASAAARSACRSSCGSTGRRHSIRRCRRCRAAGGTRRRIGSISRPPQRVDQPKRVAAADEDRRRLVDLRASGPPGASCTESRSNPSCSKRLRTVETCTGRGRTARRELNSTRRIDGPSASPIAPAQLSRYPRPKLSRIADEERAHGSRPMAITKTTGTEARSFATIAVPIALQKELLTMPVVHSRVTLARRALPLALAAASLIALATPARAQDVLTKEAAAAAKASFLRPTSTR